MAKKKAEIAELEVIQVEHKELEIFVVGEAPLILNRMSEKAKHQLLFPRGKLNSYEKQTNLKHNPREEFRAAPHRLPGGPTLLALPATAFKGSLSTAALDLPGTKKAQIARLTFVVGEYVSIFGYPKLSMEVVRSSDINHTPDIRTRAILPEWCAKFSVRFVVPLLQANAVLRLVHAGGVYIGVGDGRPEKGKMSFGRFRVVGRTDKDYQRIAKAGGRKAQEAGMQRCEPYDAQAAEMLEFWDAELKRRNFEKQQGKKAKKPPKPNGAMVEAPEEEGVSA
jgi:hypothetical protein